MSDVAPVKEDRRIKSLDVMRGLAILGILAVNAPFFAAAWQTALNPTLAPLAINDAITWSWFVPYVFFESKFITLFSLLFGASLYLVGGEREDKARGAVLRRRLTWMLIFGVIHGALIWFGDILLVYAISGAVLVFARSWGARTLLTVGSALYVLFALVSIAGGVAMTFMPAQALDEMRVAIWQPGVQDIAQVVASFRGNALESTAANFQLWTEFMPFEIVNAVPRTIAVMMIGMGLFKSGFLSGNAPNWVYGAMIAVGAAALTVVAYQAQLNLAAGFDFLHMQSRGSLVNPVLSILITLFYAGVLILCVKTGALRFLTDALAPVGRLAFTNYITQSLIMTGIFYGGRGLGLYGEVSRDTLMLIVLAIWVLQLIWSPLWLSRFSMGPLEWLWRRLSYGKPVSMAKSVPT